MAAKDGGLEVLIGAAKKDPRFGKLKGEDEQDDSEKYDEADEAEADGLDEVFSAKQAAAVRAYVDGYMKSDRS